MKRWAFVMAVAGMWFLLGSQTAVGSEEVIQVGVTASLTGKYSAPGEQQLNGMRMWADDLNARGALLGRKVKLISYDDRSDPQTSARLYERLINKDRVDLLLGPYSSELTLAAIHIAEPQKFPMVASNASSAQIWSRGYQNIFGIDTLAGNYMDAALAFLSEKGLKRIGLIYADQEFTREVADGVRRDAAAQGLQIVFDEEYDTQQTQFDDLVERLRRARPEAILGATYFDDSSAFIRAAKAHALTPKAFVFTVGPALREFGDELGADAEGVIGIAPWMRSSRMPKSQDFSYRYKEKYGYNAGYHAAYGYAAGQVLEAAVRLAGSLDKNKIREQLGSMRFRSLIGHYRVDQSGKQIDKQAYVMQWQNGSRRLIFPETIAERPAQYPFPAWSRR